MTVAREEDSLIQSFPALPVGPVDPTSCLSTRLMQDLDALVPREGVMQPRGIHISIDEYLSRLASLNQKLISVAIRKGTWDQVTKNHIEMFEANPPELLKSKLISDKIRITYSKYSLVDNSVVAEFEALLFAIRSALDILARVVAAYMQGNGHIKSYSDLAKIIEKYFPSSALSREITTAFAGWVGELRTRRDASCHYVSLTVKSTLIENTTESKSIIKTKTSVAIPKVPTPKSISIWHNSIPTIGGSRSKSVYFVRDNGEEGEIHAILDGMGTVILRRYDRIPAEPETIDGCQYVENLINSLESHIHSVLSDFLKI